MTLPPQLQTEAMSEGVPAAASEKVTGAEDKSEAPPGASEAVGGSVPAAEGEVKALASNILQRFQRGSPSAA